MEEAKEPFRLLAGGDRDREVEAFARLWIAHLHAGEGRLQEAREDLDAVPELDELR